MPGQKLDMIYGPRNLGRAHSASQKLLPNHQKRQNKTNLISILVLREQFCLLPLVLDWVLIILFNDRTLF